MSNALTPVSVPLTYDRQEALAFLQRAARLLLEYNLRSELLRRRLLSSAKTLGLENVQLMVTYRNATLFLGNGEYIHAHAPEFRINVAIAARVIHIVDEVNAGKMALADAIAELDEVERTTPRHNRWLLALIFGFAAAALAKLLSADAAAMLVTGVSSAAGLLARQEMAKRHVMLLAMPFTAALIGSVFGGLFILFELTKTPGICLIVPALMLVPGPHLINGLLDTVENNLQTGVSRLWLAAGILVAAAMGIFLGGWLTLGMTTVPPWESSAVYIPLWLDVILAGIAACGFGAFYNAPWRVLWTSIVCGMVGHGIRYVCKDQGMTLEMSTFFACLAIGLMASAIVRRMKVSFAAIAFAGAVPMMPGVLMFMSIGGAMNISLLGKAASLELIASTMGNIFSAMFVIGAMGLGLLMGSRVGEWLHFAPRERIY